MTLQPQKMRHLSDECLSNTYQGFVFKIYKWNKKNKGKKQYTTDYDIVVNAT